MQYFYIFLSRISFTNTILYEMSVTLQICKMGTQICIRSEQKNLSTNSDSSSSHSKSLKWSLSLSILSKQAKESCIWFNDIMSLFSPVSIMFFSAVLLKISVQFLFFIYCV